MFTQTIRDGSCSQLALMLAAILLCGTAAAAGGGDDIAEIDANKAEEAATNEAEESLADEVFVETRNCISVHRISRTDVLDDNSVLFYMYGSEIYLNRLPHRCLGLRMADAFSYEIRTQQLCNVDVIRVVRTFGGDLTPGVACGLGKFRPVTEEQVLLLRGKGPDDAKESGDS